MSLVKTLAKVAVGVAIAKGAQHLAQGARGGQGGGAGSMLSQLSQRAGGGAGGAGGLGALLGGGGAAGGGLGSMLESLSGAGGAGGGGLAGLLGGAGGGAGGAGGLGALLGGGGAAGALGALLGGGGPGAGAADSAPAFGQRLNQALATGGEPDTPPTPDEEALAGMMVRAMLMAAKADGRIDEGERDGLLAQLEDLSPEEQQFVHNALNDPIDVEAFAREVPEDPGLRIQLYASALSAIDLDTQAEADFLNAFAGALGLSGDIQARVHQAMAGAMS